MKTITEVEFNKLSIESRIGEIDTARKILEDFSKFYPCELAFRVSENEGKSYYEGCDVRLYYKGIELFVRFYKKYLITNWNNYPELSDSARYTIKNNISEPKQIGVLSQKKINDWLEYHYLTHLEFEKSSKEKTKEKEEFLNSIKDLNVEWSKDKSRGYIYRNGLVFNFRFSFGYIEKRIELDRVNNNLETFLQLSDNKFNSK